MRLGLIILLCLLNTGCALWRRDREEPVENGPRQQTAEPVLKPSEALKPKSLEIASPISDRFYVRISAFGASPETNLRLDPEQPTGFRDPGGKPGEIVAEHQRGRFRQRQNGRRGRKVTDRAADGRSALVDGGSLLVGGSHVPERDHRQVLPAEPVEPTVHQVGIENGHGPMVPDPGRRPPGV